MTDTVNIFYCAMLCKRYYQKTLIERQRRPSDVSESLELMCATFEASWAAAGATRMRLIGHWISD